MLQTELCVHEIAEDSGMGALLYWSFWHLCRICKLLWWTGCCRKLKLERPLWDEPGGPDVQGGPEPWEQTHRKRRQRQINQREGRVTNSQQRQRQNTQSCNYWTQRQRQASVTAQPDFYFFPKKPGCAMRADLIRRCPWFFIQLVLKYISTEQLLKYLNSSMASQ